MHFEGEHLIAFFDCKVSINCYFWFDNDEFKTIFAFFLWTVVVKTYQKPFIVSPFSTALRHCSIAPSPPRGAGLR